MTAKEVEDLMKLIKNYYSTFSLATETIKAWAMRLQHRDYNTCIEALNKYVDTSESNRPPTLSVFMNYSKVGDVWQYARLDAARGFVLWMPTPDTKIEVPVKWNSLSQAWEDDEGRLWDYVDIRL